MLGIDLIPFNQFIGRFRHSPILTLYIYAYCVRKSAVFAYLNQLYSAEFRVGGERVHVPYQT
jgi:hypothetical protein